MKLTLSTLLVCCLIVCASTRVTAIIVMLVCCGDAAVICPPAEGYAPCACQIDPYGDGTTIRLNCNNQQLNDGQASAMLDVFLTTPGISPLSWFNFPGNRLTRVPNQFPLFPQLNFVDLGRSSIESVPTGAFNFSSTLNILYLNENGLRSIQPGAFQGKYGEGSRFFMQTNNLTRFESGVFQSVLEQIAPYTGGVLGAYVWMDQNPIDCEIDLCHLAWLIRDNRQLLPGVSRGQCSNGTLFEELDPNGFLVNGVPCP